MSSAPEQHHSRGLTPGAGARVPSPEATGGAGGTFEGRVGAIALGRLLRGDRLPGLGVPPTRVRLQQRVAGALLDDVVVDGTEPGARLRTIEYQIKRQLSPAPGNAEFVEIVTRVLAAMAEDEGGADAIGPGAGAIAAGRRRFGIAGRPSTPLADLVRVTVIARSHDTADSFLTVIHKTANAGVRQRHIQLRDTVSAALATTPDEGLPSAGPGDAELDEATWRVARCVHVWQVDAEPDGSDVLAAYDRLADLLPVDGDAPALFRTLLEAAQSWAPQAGSIDLDMLRAHLERQAVALDSSPPRRVAFETFRSASAVLLDPAAARIGRRLTLPRHPLRAQVRGALDEHPAVLLSGRAGVGKSTLARLVAGDLAVAGDVVVAINLSARAGGLAALEAELGVRLAEAFSGAPIGARRVLLVDGAEQALTDAGLLLTAVLRALPPSAGLAPPWQVLLTARDEAAGPVAERVAEVLSDPAHRVAVAELLDAEVAQILAEFPVLRPVERNPRARALLLRRPYLVDLLIRAVAGSDLPDSVVGEEDLLDMVIARLVRRDDGALPGRGLPDARSDVFLALADAVIANGLPARLDGQDAEARAGLRSDDVLVQVRQSWQFAHDVLNDYAVATRLLEPDGTDLLAGAPSPRRLLRAARLVMQRRLADAFAAGRLRQVWRQLVVDAQGLADADGPRWRDVPWEALLHLGASRDVLQELSDELLAGDGEGLLRLIDVAERLGRRQGRGQDDRFPLDLALSGPTVDLLARLGADVREPHRLRAVRLVHAHLKAGCARDAVGDSGLQDAAQLPDVLLDWIGDISYGDSLEHTVGSLALLAPQLGQAHEHWLVELARHHPHDVAEPVEDPAASAALARSRPDLLLRLAGLFYLGVGLTLRGGSDEAGGRPPSLHPGSPFDIDDNGFDDDREGVRDHDFRQSQHLPMFPLGNNQAHPALGPFAALLRSDRDRGMRLIGAVVDAATAARAALEAGFGEADDPTLSLVLDTSSGTRTFTGPGTVWMWHRRTSVGPGSAQSALMALRAWAAAELRQGTPAAAVRDMILSTGKSLAFPSVAVSVLVDGIDAVTDELDPFLVHPLVWHLEVNRRVNESSGTALDLPESTRLSWTMSNVAMHLVLHGDLARRARLAELAAALRVNAEELRDADAALVAERWASELDVSHYRAQSHPDGIAFSVDYPDGVTTALAASGGAAAARALEGAGLMRQAARLRDAEDALAGAVELWRLVANHVAQGDDGLYSPVDMLAAAAAAVVMAAADGQPVEDADLQQAASTLLEGAAVVAMVAPPLRGSALQHHDSEDSPPRSPVRQMAWDDGADRSMASALPVLLGSGVLRGRAKVTAEQVAIALEQVAASPYDECRRRLLDALRPCWKLACDDEARPHAVLITVARRLLATAGYGEFQSGVGYLSATLPEPIEDALAATDDHLLELGSATFAVLLLAAGEPVDCEHGRAAYALLDALLDFDARVWPLRYARRRYDRTDAWRRALDNALATRILGGDTDTLVRRLDAFASVPEQLASLLTAISDQAVDRDRAEQLHAVWPLVLDRLLPEHRTPRTTGKAADRPSHRDVDALDDALLLVAPRDAVDWPWLKTLELGARWVATFAGQARHADRVIQFVGRLLGLRGDLGTAMVLRVMGDDVEALRRDSRYVVAFLQIVLRDSPTGPAAAQARVLLDRLAADGDEAALELQQELELDL